MSLLLLLLLVLDHGQQAEALFPAGYSCMLVCKSPPMSSLFVPADGWLHSWSWFAAWLGREAESLGQKLHWKPGMTCLTF